MGFGFPIYIDVEGNNCLVVGGGEAATEAVKLLQKHRARITVIAPQLSDELLQMEKDGVFRHIPRRFFRGDCSNALLCIAATDDERLNIAISQECKSRKTPVCVLRPAIYGTFALSPTT